jgi:flagellar assembly protein FliH
MSATIDIGWLMVSERDVDVRMPSWIPETPMRVRKADAVPSSEQGHASGTVPVAQASRDERLDETQADAVARERDALRAEVEALRGEICSLRADREELAGALEGACRERDALSTATTELGREVARMRREVLVATEPEVVKLALAVAERVVAREVQTDPALVLSWIREGLSAIGTQDDLVVALGPAIAASLGVERVRTTFEPLPVEVDAAIGAAAIEIRTRVSRIEEGVAARVAAVAEAIGGTR